MGPVFEAPEGSQKAAQMAAFLIFSKLQDPENMLGGISTCLFMDLCGLLKA